jgi:hypothetical protein
MKLENLVQGHGEVILRGDLQTVRSNLAYLSALDRYVRRGTAPECTHRPR